MLGIEERIGSAIQAQFVAQLVNGLRPFAADETGEALDGPAHAGDGLVGAREARVHGEHGRIKGRKERQGRKHIACPGNSGDIGHQRAGVVQLAEEQQVGAGGNGCGVEQVGVGLAKRRKQELPQAALSAFADVINHLGLERVLRIDLGTNAVELDAEGPDFVFVEGGYGNDRGVTAPLEFQCDGDEGVDVSKRTDIRKNNAQNRHPGS